MNEEQYVLWVDNSHPEIRGAFSVWRAELTPVCVAVCTSAESAEAALRLLEAH